MTEIKLFKSPWRAIKLILLCSIFVGLGIWGIKTGSIPSWVAWFNISFFGLGYPIGVFHLLDRRPQVIINEIGIFDQTINSDTVNWEIIRDAYPINIHQQKFICLVVDVEFKPSRSKGILYKQIVKFNESIGAQELNVSLGQIQIDEFELTEFIHLMIKATSLDRNNLLIKASQEWKK